MTNESVLRKQLTNTDSDMWGIQLDLSPLRVAIAFWDVLYKCSNAFTIFMAPHAIIICFRLCSPPPKNIEGSNVPIHPQIISDV